MLNLPFRSSGYKITKEPDNDILPVKYLKDLKIKRKQKINFDQIHLNLVSKPNLYKEAYRRICNFVNPDITVVIGQEEFMCHATVLQIYSRYVVEQTKNSGVLINGPAYVTLPEDKVTVDAFVSIYDWMVSDGRSKISRQELLEIYTAAQFLQIPELENCIWAILENVELFSEDNAFYMFLESKGRKLESIQDIMLPRIQNYFLKLVSTDQFLELNVEDLCLLLDSDYIVINDETDVFYSGLRWLKHNWFNRISLVERVMATVRFGLISSWHLVEIKRSSSCAELTEVLKNPGVYKMIDNGLSYSIIHQFNNSNPDVYNEWTESLNMEAPKERNWSGVQLIHTSLEDFNSYVSRLEYVSEDRKYNRDNFCIDLPILINLDIYPEKTAIMKFVDRNHKPETPAIPDYDLPNVPSVQHPNFPLPDEKLPPQLRFDAGDGLCFNRRCK